jgi:hypothetical protein
LGGVLKQQKQGFLKNSRKEIVRLACFSGFSNFFGVLNGIAASALLQGDKKTGFYAHCHYSPRPKLHWRFSSQQNPAIQHGKPKQNLFPRG